MRKKKYLQKEYRKVRMEMLSTFFGPFIIKLCFYMSKKLGLSLNVMYDKVLIGSV
jgi:hypothetical protein